MLNENTALIEDLLARGADPNLGAVRGVRAVSAAAFLGLSACVDVLLQHGAKPDATEADGTTALLQAARRGFPTVVTRLLDAGAELGQRDKDGRTPLHLASWTGQVAVVDVLVARGAVVDGSDNQGFTPLMLAAATGHSPSVDRLLRARANANATQPPSARTSLIHAAQRGYPNVVRLLLRGGADPNARDRGGRTALIYASARGHRPCVRLLLAHGADPALEATDGNPPIRFTPLPAITRRAPTRKWTWRAWPWRVMWALAERRMLHGLQVGVAHADTIDTTAAFQKVSDALDLVECYTPRQLQRMRQEMPRILVATVLDGFASFLAPLNMCLLAGGAVQDSKTRAAMIASFLVHEATHARLSHLGFGYAEQERTRIERLCSQAELALADKLPDAEDVAGQARQALDRLGPWHLTNARLFEQNLAALRKAGAPEWLVRLRARWARWRGSGASDIR